MVRRERVSPGLCLILLCLFMTPGVGLTSEPTPDLEVFVRTGCPHCDAAKVFLEELRRTRPTLRIRIADLDRDPQALARFERLAHLHALPVVGVPAFYLNGELIVGYQDERSTGARLLAMLDQSTTTPATEPFAACRPAQPDCTVTSPQAAETDRIVLPWVGRVSADELGLPLFTLAIGLLGHFVQATSGGALYRKSSFLLDSLGKQIFPKHINISERPHLPGAMGSGMFDDDGVATRDREVVQGGVLNGYFLSTYSARKLGMETTGNAGGSHNLILQSGRKSLDELIRGIKRGLLVTELLGHGVNYVTGDYSRGAAGYWIENGEIAYPVQEITIAGNLRDMFMGIQEVGADALVRGSKQSGSVLIDRMRIAGA